MRCAARRSPTIRRRPTDARARSPIACSATSTAIATSRIAATLAAAQVAVARAALASGDPARRGEAVHAAGRALALDPDALEAAALVTSLIVKPPEALPAELVAALRAEEIAGVRGAQPSRRHRVSRGVRARAARAAGRRARAGRC